MENEKKWRFGYVKHVVRQTQLAAASEENALGVSVSVVSVVLGGAAGGWEAETGIHRERPRRVNFSIDGLLMVDNNKE